MRAQRIHHRLRLQSFSGAIVNRQSPLLAVMRGVLLSRKTGDGATSRVNCTMSCNGRMFWRIRIFGQIANPRVVDLSESRVSPVFRGESNPRR